MKRFLLATTCLLTLNACAQLDKTPISSGDHYVNLGSSFAAGSGIDPLRVDSVKRCGQSMASYASLLADDLQLRLEDRSCSGAMSSHVLGQWNELPPQIDAVTSDTKLVTITVGGNDLGYVTNLFAASCDESKGFIYQGRKIPCSKERPPTEEDYIQLTKNMDEIARQIAVRGPEASLIFVQYVTLIPDVLCEAMGLSEEEATRLRHLAEKLSTITTAAAEENGASVLSIDTGSSTHTACDAEPWSIGAVKQANNAQGVPWHPNKRGHEVIAEKLRRMLIDEDR